MHAAWNACPHAGSRRTVSPRRTTPMHTAHCSASAAPPDPLLYSNAGMAASTSS
ncbi:hypothetical protein EE612_059294 [Oryza sativa]|nr:hypothetical protein EE612_059294 [Oryza sativa]